MIADEIDSRVDVLVLQRPFEHFNGLTFCRELFSRRILDSATLFVKVAEESDKKGVRAQLGGLLANARDEVDMLWVLKTKGENQILTVLHRLLEYGYADVLEELVDHRRLESKDRVHHVLRVVIMKNFIADLRCQLFRRRKLSHRRRTIEENEVHG